MNHLLLSIFTYFSVFISLANISSQRLSALPDSITTANTATITGTYLKLSVTPDKEAENPEAQTQLCAVYFKAKFANSPHNVIIKQSEGFIIVHADTTNQKEIEEISQTLTHRLRLSIHLVHRDTHTLADSVNAKEKSITGYTTLPHIDTNPHSGETTTTQLLIRQKAELTEKDVKSAHIAPRDYSTINIELTETGGQKMEAFTTPLTPRIDMLATVINGRVVNYATLNSNKLGKRFVITGIDLKEEARRITQSIQTPLQSTLKVTQQRTFKAHLDPQP